MTADGKELLRRVRKTPSLGASLCFRRHPVQVHGASVAQPKRLQHMPGRECDVYGEREIHLEQAWSEIKGAARLTCDQPLED